jgi:peptidoglycan/xylan/chitin deacetylase (PgdA/CDA1 family)
MRPKKIEWPNRAKIAVSFFVGLESFVKYSQYRGSGDRVDYASLAFGEYGGKVGIWRILDVFSKHNVKGTIDTNGLAAERYPDAVKELHDAGHEIVGHGWSNDVPPTALDEQEERRVIKRTLDTIASVTGKRPVGWVSPAHLMTDKTFGLLVNEGIYWSGDLPGDDLPYHVDVLGHPLVIMPRLDYANDLSLIFRPKNSPSLFFECFKTAFDRMYAEGTEGSPKLIDALVHAHIGGRPNYIDMYEQCITYAKQFPDAWFCTKGEIAKWYLDRYATAS